MKKVYSKPMMEMEEFNIRQHIAATNCNHHCNKPHKPKDGQSYELSDDCNHVDEYIESTVNEGDLETSQKHIHGGIWHGCGVKGHNHGHFWPNDCKWHS